MTPRYVSFLPSAPCPAPPLPPTSRAPSHAWYVACARSSTAQVLWRRVLMAPAATEGRGDRAVAMEVRRSRLARAASTPPAAAAVPNAAAAMPAPASPAAMAGPVVAPWVVPCDGQLLYVGGSAEVLPAWGWDGHLRAPKLGLEALGLLKARCEAPCWVRPVTSRYSAAPCKCGSRQGSGGHSQVACMWDTIYQAAQGQPLHATRALAPSMHLPRMWRLLRQAAGCQPAPWPVLAPGYLQAGRQVGQAGLSSSPGTNP